MRRATTIVLALALGACGQSHDEHAHDHAAHQGAPMAAERPTLDGASLYQLDPDLTLRDAQDAPFALASLRGRPALVTFFYGGCTTMCPLIVADVHRIVAALPEPARAETNVVLVTIDPARDTPERLRGLAIQRGMPDTWQLIGGDEGSIRALASTLGMTYRRLPDGSFAHAALYTVLDREGRVVHQLEGTGRDIGETTAALTRAAEPGPS
ncbi:SCO family protein [Sandaracinus amylolyticus]|uniref:SCO family protein n=1 Tax=Sandaracinus amylolyticus TaxID=927083 RepID=UPI001F29EE7F|nr:SCO family protein [Sandaracinus amylolyticus]UJR84136.1 Hypothetical protein I5071_62070 [Sandaracinus amylolyticus]